MTAAIQRSADGTPFLAMSTAISDAPVAVLPAHVPISYSKYGFVLRNSVRNVQAGLCFREMGQQVEGVRGA